MASVMRGLRGLAPYEREMSARHFVVSYYLSSTKEKEIKKMQKIMKATFRNQRVGTSSKHNDRTNTANAKHIDQTKIDEDLFYIVNETFDDFDEIEYGKGKMEEEEIKRYEMLFLGAVEEQNKRNISEGHKERCRNIIDVYQYKNTQPDETLLQIGNQENAITKDELSKTFKVFLKKVTLKYPNMKVLSFSLHMDETSPHIHMRETYIDKRGRCNQTQAIKDMGFTELPYPYKKEDKYNNVKVPFTDEVRELWYITAEQELGIKIDREVKNPSQKHKSKLEHEVEILTDQLELTREKCRYNETKANEATKRAEEEAKKVEDLIKKNKELEESVKNNQVIIHRQRNEYDTVEKEKEKALKEKDELINENNKLINENNKLSIKIDKVKAFLSELIENTHPFSIGLNKDEKTNTLVDMMRNVSIPGGKMSVFQYITEEIRNKAKLTLYNLSELEKDNDDLEY